MKRRKTEPLFRAEPGTYEGRKMCQVLEMVRQRRSSLFFYVLCNLECLKTGGQIDVLFQLTSYLCFAESGNNYFPRLHIAYAFEKKLQFQMSLCNITINNKRTKKEGKQNQSVQFSYQSRLYFVLPQQRSQKK